MRRVPECSPSRGPAIGAGDPSRAGQLLAVAFASVFLIASSCPLEARTPLQKASSPKSARVGQSWKGRVVVVADGDTIEVMRGGRSVRIRLAGIDAPETGQPWNRRARQRLAELVSRRTVDVVVLDVDRYGRDVAEVTMDDGRRLTAVMVGEGLAWWYRAFSTDRELEALERQAREARRGLWSERAPTPPWIWRQRHPRHRT